MVTIDQLCSAYAESVKNGENIAQLADKLGLKLTSLTQRMTSVRKTLREEGATEEEIKKIFPVLKRRTGPRVSARSTSINSLLQSVRTPTEPAPEAPETPEAPEVPESTEV